MAIKLDSIINIDDTEYSITAETAKTAEKVVGALTVNIGKNKDSSFAFNGETAKEITLLTAADVEQDITAALEELTVEDPTESGPSTDRTFIDSIRQENGKIVATKKSLPDFNEENIKLKSDLYTYAPIGNAQKASNGEIGSGATISNTNPGKLGTAGTTSLKDVFNKIFGTQQDQEPTITTSNAKLSVSAGTTVYGGGEFGTEVSATTVDVTFTLSNSGTAEYGYRVGTNKTSGSQTFYYPITKQSEGDLKITLPSGQEASAGMVTAGTYVSHSSNVLYCNFDANKKVTIKISLPKGYVTTSSQTRYGQITANVILGSAQKENQLTAGTAITKFLTYLGNDASNTSALTGGNKSNTAGAYTISAGSYSPYYLASTSSTLTSVTKNVATKYTSGSAVSITCDTDSYIWFLLPPGTSGAKSIQYEALGNWYEFSGGTSGPTDVALALDSGIATIYKAYRTNKQAAAGTTQFKIV